MKIYCDNGACPQELKVLQKKGIVELYMWRYENKNRHIQNSGLPSKVTWPDLKNYTWDTLAANHWSDFSGSDKYEQIITLLGLANKRVDILHLDSAYKSQCEVFVTNDKDDIWSKRAELEELLGLRVFNVFEMPECVEYIGRANKED